MLEPRGEKREFWFFCEMASGGNPQVTRHFWRFDRDRLGAVTGVLQQVEDSAQDGWVAQSKTMPDLAKLVIKRFPENRNMQLVCLRLAAGFHCSRCHKTKRAKLLAVVAEDWDRLFCEGCYEEVLSQQQDESAEDMIPKAWLGAVVSLRDAEKDNVAMGVPLAGQVLEWEDFKAAMLDGDEVCEFFSPAGTSEPLAGCTGYALVRQGEVIKYIVTCHNI